MKTAADILHEHGIAPPPGNLQRYYTTCPQCSARRSRAHQKTPCLGVIVKGDGVTWGCNHCLWKGGGYYNGKINGSGGTPATTYDYSDEQGNLLSQKVRNPPGNAQRFWQRRPDGHGGWINNVQGVRKVIYRLPEVLEAIASEHTIVVVEGEKDVDNLWRIGVPATCSPDGASEVGKAAKWQAAYSESLAGADIVVIPDHDDPGYAHAKAAAQASQALARRVRILALAKHWPACPKGGDVSDWLAAGHTREELDTLIERAPDHGKDAGEDPSRPGQLPPLPYINMSHWDDEPVPQQEWSVLNRIPRYQTALFSGEGAIGKSTVELHRVAAHVLEREWLGTLPEPGPAIFIDAEDHAAVLHRRLAAITRHYKVSFSDLIRGGLHLISLAGEDAVLATASRSGKVEPTQLYNQILEAAGDIRPATIGIASSANVFAGNENDRNQVQQFIGLLTRMAIVSRGSVNLISHPSLTGIATDTGMSGTTQWHNAVRARMFLRGMKPAADEQPQGDLREIIFKKNQYGPISENVVLQYRDGMFLPAPGVTSLDRAAYEAKAENVFLDLLARFTRENRNVAAKPCSSYAPRVFAREPEAKGVSSKALADAMGRLFKSEKIWNEPHGRADRESYRVALRG